IADGEDSYGGRRAIMVFNVDASFATELDPQAFSLRGQPAIGNNTVAFVDDVGTGWDLRIVNVGPPAPSRLLLSEDGLFQRNPNISADGNVIVWERCDVAAACQVMKALRSTDW